MLKVNNLSFKYEEKAVLNQLSFSVRPGNALAIMGKSGSGKSTLIKLLYGLLDAHEGSITWNDVKILGPAYHLVPGMSFMKYVAQDFDLMPYTTLYENIGYFLSNFDLKHKKEKIEELIQLVGLTDFTTRKISTLSGGQMQRAALAKALASQPEILLLDEPFSHLDHPNKIRLSRAIFKFAKKNNITVIFATHIPEEALQFADEVLVLHQGTMIFKGTPDEAYLTKNDVRVAQLFGDINELSSTITEKLVVNDNIFRPHQLIISTKKGVAATVLASYFTGENYLIELLCEGQTVFVKSNVNLATNTKVFIDIK